jgi:hypothetical protein
MTATAMPTDRADGGDRGPSTSGRGGGDDPWAWLPPDAGADGWGDTGAASGWPGGEAGPRAPRAPPRARRPPPRRRAPPPGAAFDPADDPYAAARAAVEADWGAAGRGAGEPRDGDAPRARWTAAADRAATTEAALDDDGYGPENEVAWGGEGEGGDDDTPRARPDIEPLTPAEVNALLPAAPAPSQVAYFNADGATVLQRVGLCLLVTLATAKAAPAAAAGALTGPLWYPLLAAAARNRRVRASGSAIGLWRARVLAAGVANARPPRPGAGPGAPTLTLIVGDDSGATCEVCVPYERDYDRVAVGEAAELLAVATADGFARFRALREVYLPGAGLWIADYPAADRRAFVRVSLAVEAERASAGGWGDGGGAGGEAPAGGVGEDDAYYGAV